jgi:hypothetical protein
MNRVKYRLGFREKALTVLWFLVWEIECEDDVGFFGLGGFFDSLLEVHGGCLGFFFIGRPITFIAAAFKSCEA